MLVLGDREVEQATVAVSDRSRGDPGMMPLAEFEQMALQLVRSRAVAVG